MNEKNNFVCVVEEAPFFVNKKYVGINYLKTLLESNDIDYYIEESNVVHNGESIMVKKIFVKKESLEKLDEQVSWEVMDVLLFIRKSYTKNLDELSYYLKVDKLPFLKRKKLLKLLDLQNSSINELEYRNMKLGIDSILIANTFEKTDKVSNEIINGTLEEDTNIKNILSEFLKNIFIRVPRYNLKAYIYNSINKELVEYQKEIERIEKKYPEIFKI